MGLSTRRHVELDNDDIADAMAGQADKAAEILARFSETMPDESAEAFVEFIAEQAMEPRTALALKALAGLILKGCEA